ncbi:MAG: metallophosphoesterase [Chloroflexi bacterium]|nr:metallophosphoesterase [Chloroflexota bacterium]
MPEFRIIFIIVGVAGILAPVLAVIIGFIPASARHFFDMAITASAVIGIVVPLALATYYWRDSHELSAATPPMLLVMDGVGADGVPNLALVFRTEQPTKNTLFYGAESLSEQIVESSATREHVLMLKNLKSGTHYQWRLNSEATCSFATPSNDVLYHFGVGGDAHFGKGLAASAGGDPNIMRSILKYVTEPRNQFNTFFIVGDMVNLGSPNEEWMKAMDTLAPFTCGVPLRPVMGNHDAIINGAVHYLKYFYPEGMQTPRGTRLYYRIDSGRAHIIMLNLLWGVETFTAEQRAWFIQQMESIPVDDWKIVMMHSMAYSSGNISDGYAWYDPVEMVQQVAPLLEKYQVDLVISGHNHHLEFLQRIGVSYAVVGTLGGALDPDAAYRSPASAWYRSGTHGFLDVTVRPESINLRFRDANANELKAFAIGKNK